MGSEILGFFFLCVGDGLKVMSLAKGTLSSLWSEYGISKVESAVCKLRDTWLIATSWIFVCPGKNYQEGVVQIGMAIGHHTEWDLTLNSFLIW